MKMNEKSYARLEERMSILYNFGDTYDKVLMAISRGNDEKAQKMLDKFNTTTEEFKYYECIS